MIPVIEDGPLLRWRSRNSNRADQVVNDISGVLTAAPTGPVLNQRISTIQFCDRPSPRNGCGH